MSNLPLLERESHVSNGAILLGAGLALASFIILPAVAARLGIGSSLTGAMRIALMKASTKICDKTPSNHHTNDKSCPPEIDCDH